MLQVRQAGRSSLVRQAHSGSPGLPDVCVGERQGSAGRLQATPEAADKALYLIRAFARGAPLSSHDGPERIDHDALDVRLHCGYSNSMKTTLTAVETDNVLAFSLCGMSTQVRMWAPERGNAVTDLATRALTFIQAHGPVLTRDLFENGPARTLVDAKSAVRELRKAGAILRAETARGGFAGWVAP